MTKKIRPKRLHVDSNDSVIIVEYIVDNDNEDKAGEVNLSISRIMPI